MLTEGKAKGCRDPPPPFKLKNRDWMEKKMNDNTKCFIKVGNKLYEEITIAELKKRKREIDTYKEKKFVPLQRKITRSFCWGL